MENYFVIPENLNLVQRTQFLYLVDAIEETCLLAESGGCPLTVEFISVISEQELREVANAIETLCHRIDEGIVVDFSRVGAIRWRLVIGVGAAKPEESSHGSEDEKEQSPSENEEISFAT